MNKLGLLYQAIKNVEEKTLFKLEYIEDNELHFVYHRDEFEMIVSSERVYIDPEEHSIIMEYDEMCAIMQLMQILEEFN